MTDNSNYLQQLMQQAWQAVNNPDALDPLNLHDTWFKASVELWSNPNILWEANLNAWQDYVQLWQQTASKLLGCSDDTSTTAGNIDKRFRDPEWNDVLFFDVLKQAYLIGAHHLQSAIEKIDQLDPASKEKLRFFIRQYTDALAPSNFALTNPEVLRKTIESYGVNLVNGLENLLQDLQRGKGQLQISMSDQQAFELGKNIATTAGQVVYENTMMQLIQYTPSTPQVNATPILIAPPWINKFYILDLQAKNSMVRWLVEQGHTVFMISWVNPDASLAQKSFDDYLQDGMLCALDVVEKITGSSSCNLVGYCLGGTLLACTLAYLTATKQSQRVASASFFTSLIDFSEPGELGVFIDEKQVANLERRMQQQGYLDGKDMATTFNMLRANDLIWSFVINNYLLGKPPMAFDLLYWNADSTRMPAAMHSFYLRKMYLENKLVEAGGISLHDTPIDMRQIKTPAFFLSTEDDHIAPWRSTFQGAQLFKGPVNFVLGESGHIAGVVNPPEKNKYGFKTNKKPLKDADSWYQQASHHQGSWWPTWHQWLQQFANGQVPARQPGSNAFPCIEAAPGRYVKVRS